MYTRNLICSRIAKVSKVLSIWHKYWQSIKLTNCHFQKWDPYYVFSDNKELMSIPVILTGFCIWGGNETALAKPLCPIVNKNGVLTCPQNPPKTTTLQQSAKWQIWVAMIFLMTSGGWGEKKCINCQTYQSLWRMINSLDVINAYTFFNLEICSLHRTSVKHSWNWHCIICRRMFCPLSSQQRLEEECHFWESKLCFYAAPRTKPKNKHMTKK
jgi:hypothetical protein